MFQQLGRIRAGLAPGGKLSFAVRPVVAVAVVTASVALTAWQASAVDLPNLPVPTPTPTVSTTSASSTNLLDRLLTPTPSPVISGAVASAAPVAANLPSNVFGTVVRAD